ncbi:hypothetical protein GQ600_3136 [Phytophthora cactorum]|nr:hypothetical protein GQ600_3136 [Phytophthora cactorum]
MMSNVAALSSPWRSHHTGTDSGHRQAPRPPSHACVHRHSHLVAVRYPPRCRHSSPGPESVGTAPCVARRCRASPRVGLRDAR